jgi:hypothetical protein
MLSSEGKSYQPQNRKARRFNRGPVYVSFIMLLFVCIIWQNFHSPILHNYAHPHHAFLARGFFSSNFDETTLKLTHFYDIQNDIYSVDIIYSI